MNNTEALNCQCQKIYGIKPGYNSVWSEKEVDPWVQEMESMFIGKWEFLSPIRKCNIVVLSMAMAIGIPANLLVLLVTVFV